MVLTHHEWGRQIVRSSAVGHYPVFPSFTNQISTAVIGAAATVLRSRFFPRLGVNVNDATVNPETWIVRTDVRLVAWYDPLNTGDILAPDDSDPRIIATGQLTPHLHNSVRASTNGYFVQFDTLAEPIQSFAQRKPDPATLSSPAVYTAIWVEDATGTLLNTFATGIGIQWSCYGEVLFGAA